MRGMTPSGAAPRVTTRLGPTCTWKRDFSASSAGRATTAVRRRSGKAASSSGSTTATSMLSLRCAGSPVKNSSVWDGSPAAGARKASILSASTAGMPCRLDKAAIGDDIPDILVVSGAQMRRQHGFAVDQVLEQMLEGAAVECGGQAFQRPVDGVGFLGIEHPHLSVDMHQHPA